MIHCLSYMMTFQAKKSTLINRTERYICYKCLAASLYSGIPSNSEPKITRRITGRVSIRTSLAASTWIITSTTRPKLSGIFTLWKTEKETRTLCHRKLPKTILHIYQRFTVYLTLNNTKKQGMAPHQKFDHSVYRRNDKAKQQSQPNLIH